MSDALVASFARELRAQNFARWQRGAIYAREHGPGAMLVDVRGATTLGECLARPMRYVRTRDLAPHVLCAATLRAVIAHLVSAVHPRGARFTLVRGDAAPAARGYEMCVHYRCVDTDAAAAPVPARFAAWLGTVVNNGVGAQLAWFYYANGMRNLVLGYTASVMGAELAAAYGRARGAPRVMMDPFGDDIDDEDDADGTHTCAELEEALACACARCPHRYVFVRSLGPRVLALAAASGWHISRGVLAPNVNCDEAASGARLVLWAPFQGAGSVGCCADGCERDAEFEAPRMLQVCSGCEIYRYCSAECARAQWPRHKSVCRAYQRSEQEQECTHKH